MPDLVLKGDDIRDQFGINQWLEHRQVVTSLDLAKRTPILPGLRQVLWDLIIVDEAHRMSWSPPGMKKIFSSSEQDLILFLFRLAQRGKERATCSLHGFPQFVAPPREDRFCWDGG